MRHSRIRVRCVLVAALLLGAPVLGAPGGAVKKQGSAFYPADRVEVAWRNIREHAWARTAAATIVERAQPWLDMSDDALWSLMFGHTISRSWMVWSDGQCPACRQAVPMYNWKIDALGERWKVRCPHCNDAFPKNDFERFYVSGLDPRGVFDPKRADRSLLFHAGRPDPADARHRFGVDDGEGYVEGGKRWRFIGAYLIYGQWKQLVVDGIKRLAAAYVVTGNPAYAHKAGILLDRVADLYPTFDFAREGLVYEKRGAAGYVSTWHDACEETREMVLAYDHAKFMHSHFGTITTRGLELEPAPDYDPRTIMRNFKRDPDPETGWSATWDIEDRYGYLPAGTEVHLRYTDLTSHAEAYTCEAWVTKGLYGTSKEAWIPRLMVRRAPQGETSTFVAVIEPYGTASSIAQIRRLPLVADDGRSYPDTCVAVEVRFVDGQRDLFVTADTENPMGLSPAQAENRVLVQQDWDLRLDGDTCLIRRDRRGRVIRVAACRARTVAAGNCRLEMAPDVEFIEVAVKADKARVVAGRPADIHAFDIQPSN